MSQGKILKIAGINPLSARATIVQSTIQSQGFPNIRITAETSPAGTPYLAAQGEINLDQEQTFMDAINETGEQINGILAKSPEGILICPDI